ncbi:MAG: hypothetical protein HYU36_04210 [Planctomycetes bacterium]|nr:hypothetical protein [Planctomycetota bacterium]
MSEMKPIRAVEMVRRIRDEMARELAGKSEAEIIAFFRRAGDAARQDAKRRFSGYSPSDKPSQAVKARRTAGGKRTTGTR